MEGRFRNPNFAKNIQKRNNMRKNIIYCLMAMLGMVVAACSSDLDDENASGDFDFLTQADNIDDSVKDFFNDYISVGLWDRYHGFVLDERHDISCHFFVNSKEELQALYVGEKELPDIDFSKYTLLIGQEFEGNTGYCAKELKLKSKGGKYLLEIYTEVPNLQYHANGAMAYWSIYPKLKTKDLEVKVIVNNGKSEWYW